MPTQASGANAPPAHVPSTSGTYAKKPVIRVMRLRKLKAPEAFVRVEPANESSKSTPPGATLRRRP
jgi:hypothetical protein